MNRVNIATKANILEHNLENLLNGKADIGTASALGVVTASLKEFLEGKANISMASKLGLLESELQQLLNRIDKKGAIGFVLGVLMKKNLA